MSAAPVTFPFIDRDPTLGPAGLAPYIPASLSLGQATADVLALLDTGSAVCVLPDSVGARLGAAWGRLPRVGPLAGVLSGAEARGLVVSARVGTLPPVRLAFAWVKTNAVPVIFGQMNFFLEFDVCFHRSRLQVEIRPAAKLTP